MHPKERSPEDKLTRRLASMADSLRELESRLGPPDSSKAPSRSAPGIAAREASEEAPGTDLPRAPTAPKSAARKGTAEGMRLLAEGLMAPQVLGAARAEGSRDNARRRTIAVLQSILAAPPAQGSSDAGVTVCLPRVSSLERSSLGGSVSRSADESFWKVAALKSGAGPIGERYVLDKAIGRGAVSHVLAGVDVKTGRPVAVKLVSATASHLHRRSLESTVDLEHESILRIEDFGLFGPGGLFLVMPLLGGRDLRELLSAQRTAVEALLLAFRKVCAGIAHAHLRDVVHSDLKPANIRVEPDGQTTVIDWGLARRTGERLSERGEAVGTPLYMAPEQVEAKPVTPRTDVYSLGVVLYELLTGVHPAGPADGIARVLDRVVKEPPPPPSRFRRGLSSELEEIVLRCLRKEPSERFENARELLEGLEACV